MTLLEAGGPVDAEADGIAADHGAKLVGEVIIIAEQPSVKWSSRDDAIRGTRHALENVWCRADAARFCRFDVGRLSTGDG